MRETFLPYCRPDTGTAEAAAIAECVHNGWLTTGPKVHEFEQGFAERAGVKHAVAVSSCTAALHVGLLAAGVEPGDDVVMPALTFVAGAQCTIEIGARPVFCDVDPKTLTADVEHVEAALTPSTKAIIAMPYAGRPMNVRRLAAFARERGIALIEDAAHATGMLDGGEWAGTRSTLAAYSFYATKNLTTAEGGMLVTNEDAIAERVRALSLHGMDRDAWKRYTARGSWRYDVREPGFKYNMPDVAAAMGLAQLARLNEMQAQRRRLAQRYVEAFSGLAEVEVQAPASGPGDVHSWCMFVLRVLPESGVDRDRLIEELKRRNVGTSVHYIPTHHFSAYRRFASELLAQTDDVWRYIISLPLYSGMCEQDVNDVIDAVNAGVTAAKQPGVMLAR